MLSKWSALDLLLCSSRSREWSRRDGSSGNSPLLNRPEIWRWESGVLIQTPSPLPRQTPFTQPPRLKEYSLFEHEELSPEEQKKRMQLGIWSFEAPEVKPRPVVQSITDMVHKTPKHANNNTPRKQDKNKASKQEPLIDINKQQQIADQQQINNPAESSNGLSQFQLVNEVNRGSQVRPLLTGNISTVSEDFEKFPASESNNTGTISDRSTVDGSLSPDRRSNGRPGSNRRLFTKVTPSEHLSRKDSMPKGGRPQSGRPPGGSSPLISGRQSAPNSIH